MRENSRMCESHPENLLLLLVLLDSNCKDKVPNCKVP